MNNLIRELFEQTIHDVDIVTGNDQMDDELAKMYIPDCFAERFAELIIRECGEAVDSWDSTYPFPLYSLKIKNHFGFKQ